MTPVQTSLLTTLTDLAIRSEVHSCLSEMLQDVETTMYLRHEVERAAAQEALHQAWIHHTATIMEAQAERVGRDESHLQLADQMVVEVMALSRELEDLLQWKRDHAHKVDDYDRLLQQVQSGSGSARTDSEHHLERTTTTKAHIPNDTAPSVVPAPKEGWLLQGNKTAQEFGTEAEKMPESDQKPAAIKSGHTITPVASTEEDAEEQPPLVLDGSQTEEEPSLLTTPIAATTTTTKASLDQSAVVDESSAAVSPAPAGAAVVLDEEEEEETTTSLVDLDVDILMTIFGFIDAMDILNMAQINAAMYSKIDNIFGITEDGQSPPQPTIAPLPAPVGPPPPIQPAAPVALTTPPRPTISASAPSTATPTGTSAAAGSTPGPVNRLFSILQPAKTAPGGGSGSNNSTNKNNNKRASAAPSLTASAVESMAAKLNDTEVAAILSMTDKLHRMDKEVLVLRQEKEAMAAQLEGTEAVKQYLINKVREVEHKLSKSRDDEIKVAHQIASDQEVIAFLDSRVRELERQTETLTKETTKSQSELTTTKVQTSKKITMLSDMLKYEREKLKEEEGEWKAKKKVLVKEVRSCRAQILALQAERDGLKEQNEMLKRAIVTTSATTGNSSGMGKNSMNRPRGESIASGGSIK